MLNTFINKLLLAQDGSVPDEIVEDLIEARYARDKQAHLRRANLRLEKLRVLLRLSQRLHYLDHKRFEYAMKCINEVGKMLGGWLRQQQ